MGQHKFEEQIGRQLREREITPSADAWNKLNERLDKEEKKSHSYYWIAGIAASFVTGILILSLVFNNSIIEDTPTIVDTPVESAEEENVDNALEVKENKEPLNSKINQVAAEDLKEPETYKVKKVITAPVIAENAEQRMATTEGVREVQEQVKTEINTAETEILPKRLEEVIAEVSSEVNSNGDMTEAEVDALLYKAAAEISLQRERESLSGKVDATALLMEVEMELEQGFREKVFDILKEGYLKARTAVANRNF